VISRTATAERFSTDVHVDRLLRAAPIPASSGTTIRHAWNRGGDRQINCLRLTRG
jgi:hypothetical protein